MQAGYEQHTVGETVGLLWAWWRCDALPPLAPTLPFTVRVSEDVEILANLIEVSHERVQEWLQEGHRAYLVYIGTQPAAVGISAKERE